MTTSASPTPLRRGRFEPVPTHGRWRSVRVNAYAYAAVMLALFLGTIQVSQTLGLWTTSGRVTATGEKVVVTGADPAEIKGWMTIQDVTSAYGVPSQDFYARFGVPAETPGSTALKDLEAVAPGFSTEAVRTWLGERAATAPGP